MDEWRAALKPLHERLRAVVVWRYVEGLTHADVGGRLVVSASRAQQMDK